MNDIAAKYNFPEKIQLASLPTPVKRLNYISSLTPGIELSIKRDDLTGCALTGNKARKLEFILADAQRQNSTILLTCGGVQSNHARATAIAGRELGMKSLLFLRGEEPKLPEANLALDLLVGAQIKYVTDKQYLQGVQMMMPYAQLLKEQGEIPYIVPEGGSNALGSLGYALAMAEINEQLDELPDYIVTAVGSGGTLAGLVMGTQLLKIPTRVVGVNVCANAPYFQKKVAGIIQEAKEKFGLPVHEEGDWEIIDGYVGPGYAQNIPDDITTLRMVAEKEGIILDPVYTIKAFRGLLTEIGQGRFGSDKKILFLHTGGIFGLLTQTCSSTLFTKRLRP